MWFTENPWPPAVLLLAACAACALAWQRKAGGALAAAALGCLLLAGATFVIERLVVTDREQIESQIHLLARAFERKDKPAVLGAFSAGAGKWRNLAEEALELVTIRRELSIKDVSVRVYGQGARATSRFRANGTVEFKGVDVGHQPSRWELTWQREQGQWKVIDVQRLNPFSEEVMQPFEQNSH